MATAVKFIRTKHSNIHTMDLVEAELSALLKPYALTPTDYINKVIEQHGGSGLVRGEAIMPPGTIDAAEYLRLSHNNNELLKVVTKDVETLAGYIDNPDIIPGYIRVNKQEMCRILNNKKGELNTYSNYAVSIARTSHIIDGEAFLSQMSPLLTKYAESLKKTQHEEAERIVRERSQ